MRNAPKAPANAADAAAHAERARAAAAAIITVRPPPDVKPGSMIGDKYRIERELGRGGFGVVVRAIHLTLDQRVAIKVLTEGEGSTETEWAEDAARFRVEAKATAALRSDHVVRVLDVDVLESGYPYIVMEYLEGKTLHDLVHGSKTLLPIEEAVDYTIQVLAALAEAHAVGIVHRDLKPANVFLAKGIVGGMSIAKVLDFGVSKMLGASSQRLTQTGAVVGTVAYMSPEQMLDAKRVDGRGDLWSVGLVLYEALAKKHPFGAVSAGPKVVTAILNDPLPSIRSVRQDIPPVLEAALSRLLDKSPDKRFQTAVQAANALAPFGSLRSRPVLEEIRRAPAPTGAAAPNAVSVRRSPSSQAAAPPSSASRSASSAASAKARAPRKRKSSKVVVLLLAVVTAALAIGVLAGYLFYIHPRLTHEPLTPATPPAWPVDPPPPPSSSPSTSTSASASSASSTPQAAISVWALPSAPPSPSAKPRSNNAPAEPKPSASSGASSCDPPFVYDPVTNMKKYKPECL